MASPKHPGQDNVLPITNPDHVKEVFSNDVLFQIRNGAVTFTFCSIRACGADANGLVSEERAMVSQVSVPLPVGNAMQQAYQHAAASVEAQEAQIHAAKVRPN